MKKFLGKLLMLVGVLVTPIVLFLYGTAGMLTVTQSTAAVESTNAGGMDYQLLRVVTEIQKFGPLSIFLAVFIFVVGAYLNAPAMARADQPKTPN